MLLSICIPTFNRAKYLDALLASICPQLCDDVEILIFDNASSDDTPSVVQAWQATKPGSITYARHDSNIGGNPNIAAAARGGRGLYVWVLGDDEIIPAGALPIIVQYLRGGLDYLILNHSLYDQSMTWMRIRKWHRLGRDKLLRGADEAMRFLGPTPSFISVVIAKRGILDSLSPTTAAEYASFGFNQLYAFYNGLTEGSVGLFTADVLVYARSNDAEVNYDWNHYFVTGLGEVFKDLVLNKKYQTKSSRAALGQVILRYHVRRLVKDVVSGAGGIRIRRLSEKYYSSCWQYWILLWPISIMPRFIFRILKFFIKLFRKINVYEK